jgi:hypothetical protein
MMAHISGKESVAVGVNFRPGQEIGNYIHRLAAPL